MQEMVTNSSTWSMPTAIAGIILFLPLFLFLFLAVTKKDYQKVTAVIATVVMFLTAFLSIRLFLYIWPNAEEQVTLEWFKLANDIKLTAGLIVDFESTAMLVVVFLISALVHLYSLKYMEKDEGFKKYFTFLSLFTFSMAGIVLSNNLLVTFVFWELVGLSSYLLIGHWYKKDSASYAANKAFIVNRLGDAGFIIGLAILFTQFQTLDISSLTLLLSESKVENGVWQAATTSMNEGWLTAAGICLFLGAVGKSAQFPLLIWLPDAMEGPTPISALIHAATMVAAGVYLMIRIFALLSIDALTVIAFTGAITAFMGAVAALTQHDIKKVLAYSTISQLGYMLMGIGVGAYGAAFFHLFTHAFFKAGLFLSAGSVIYALHQFADKEGVHFDTQDMRNMGGLRKHLPITFLAFLFSALALVGIPFFSGFLSKDALLSGAYAWAGLMGGEGFSLYYLIPDLGFITVVLTALYMARQVLLVFYGKFRFAAQYDGIKNPVVESPLLLRVSIVLLAALSFGLVWSFNPLNFSSSWFLRAVEAPLMVSPGFDQMWQPSLIELSNANHLTVSGISVGLITVGLIIGFIYYRPGGRYANEYFTRPLARGFFQRISYYNWYLDPLYFHTIQRPVLLISTGAQWIERKVIDKAIDTFAVVNVIFAHVIGWIDRTVIDGIVNLVAGLSRFAGNLTKSLQVGKAQNYIVIAILGLILLVYWII